jgi:ssDNA-binding replication factor A large subunit
MATETITEERFASLEAKVEWIQSEIKRQKSSQESTSPDFLDTMVGIHADSPDFEEMTREIEAEREKERREARRLLAKDKKIQ